VALRGGPSNDAPVVGHVAVGDAVEIADVRRQWFRLAGSEPRWINLYHLEMFPRTVTFAARSAVNLRAAPGGEVLTRVDLDGTYPVLDAARHGRFDEPWYRLTVGGAQGWVAGRLVERRSYRMPGVHLIAGLYRYGRGQFEVAASEFEAFLDSVPEQDNVMRAATLRFLAASRLAATQGPDQVTRALADLDQAMRYTPFDPDARVMRALVQIGSSERVGDAVVDIHRALELDRGHPGARRLLEQIDAASGPRGLEAFSPAPLDAAVQSRFEDLRMEHLRGPR